MVCVLVLFRHLLLLTDNRRDAFDTHKQFNLAIDLHRVDDSFSNRVYTRVFLCFYHSRLHSVSQEPLFFDGRCLAVSDLQTQLWVLFGTTNQLLAGLVLLTATVYLVANRRPSWVTAVPMLVMLVITLWAMVLNLSNYIDQGKTTSMIVGSCILALAIGLIAEVAIYFMNRWSSEPAAEG